MKPEIDYNDVLKKLTILKKHMIGCSVMLDDCGHWYHANELFGASKMLQTWIDGIEKEEK